MCVLGGEQVARARDVGVNSIMLYPKVPDALKVSSFSSSLLRTNMKFS